jgi:sugar lactone lactonase YvrE
MIAARSDEILKPRLLRDPALGRARVWPVGNRVGESPVWHAGEQALYWIDVRGPQLLRLQPGSHRITRWELPDVVGAVALKRGHLAWLALRHALVEIDLHSGRLRQVAAVEEELPHNRLNDGKTSPSGRWFVFGSMDDRPQKEATGGLYRADAAGRVEKLADGLVVANGIAFSNDGRTLYFSDSARGLVMSASWDESHGSMGRAHIIAMLGEELGRPDGAVVDAEDCYWSAGVSAGVLHRLDPNGRVRQRLPLPCRAPTMCAYGGRDAGTLFVTSLVRPHWEARGPCDGALLAFRAPVPGRHPAELG